MRQTRGGGYWNGYVSYAGTHRFTLWVRVKVLVTAERVTALEALRPGIPVEATQLRVESREEVPVPGFAATAEEIVGRVPRRTIAAGAALRPEWFEAPKAIKRGDTVQVEVIQGGARLKLEGIAEASGVVGDTISIQNPTSHQRFPARIMEPGRVLVAKGNQ